jgi:hypothetical protein
MGRPVDRDWASGPTESTGWSGSSRRALVRRPDHDSVQRQPWARSDPIHGHGLQAVRPTGLCLLVELEMEVGRDFTWAMRPLAAVADYRVALW